MDIDSMTKSQFEELLYRAYNIQLEDNMDINQACINIRISINHLLILLKFPEMRPLQKTLDHLQDTTQAIIMSNQ